MKVTFDGLTLMEQLWSEASAKRAEALKHLLLNNTAENRAEFDMRCEVERDTQARWSIASQAYLNGLMEQSLAHNTRIAVALEKLASIQIERHVDEKVARLKRGKKAGVK